MKFGIFGGSFDPVHTGHLLVAQDACEHLGLDRIVFIPAALSPFKTGELPVRGEHRAAMLEAAISKLPWAEVSRLELEREGISYTIDTVRGLMAQRPEAEWTLLIGMDNLRSLHQWREAKTLLELVDIATLARPGQRKPRDLHLPAPLDRKLRSGIIKSRRIDISSTEIRQRRREGKLINNLVPDAVLQYIEHKSLYTHEG